jgi:hypothetical protein
MIHANEDVTIEERSRMTNKPMRDTAKRGDSNRATCQRGVTDQCDIRNRRLLDRTSERLDR